MLGDVSLSTFVSVGSALSLSPSLECGGRLEAQRLVIMLAERAKLDTQSKLKERKAAAAGRESASPPATSTELHRAIRKI